LKNDYRQFGVELEVVHHTELINGLLKSGRLKLARPVDTGNTVFHDSCYLGRYNGIYDAPRQVISSATGHAPSEMERRRDNGFCCGAGGGRMWMEEEIGHQVNIARVEEALKVKPDTVCVSCPYCMTMFEDGLQNKDAHDVKVLDLAEIVVRALD
jgi:Fe-S oxidoreductase